MTGLTTEELEERFSDKDKRIDMFNRATNYGEEMFRLIAAIDEADKKSRLLRTLVI